jgi:broad specificity phosphatase PhoE
MHLLLVRHGETEWNVQRRIQGWTNSSLTEFGLSQVALLGKRLEDVPLTAVYSSDAERAQQSALAAIGTHSLTLNTVIGLRETSWGTWEGKTGQELADEEPDLWAKFLDRGQQDASADQADWESTTLVPEGESMLHASYRINSAVETIIGQHKEVDDFVLIVGHGGSLRFVIAALLKMRPSSSRLFHLDNASLSHFVIDSSRTTVKLLNDSSHWSGALAS